MTARAVELRGFALHAGTAACVTLSRHDGPLAFGRGSRRIGLAELRVARTDLGVALADGAGFEVDLVEHVLAATAGLAIRRDLAIVVDGPELPILDGGARVFADALAELEIAPRPPSLVVEKAGRLAHASSVYEFEPLDGIDVGVETKFDHPAIGAARASWDGTASSFVHDIAPARTFGFAGQADELARRGRARLAATALREAVLVFDDGPPPPFSDREPARHKLLDLIGDLAFYGGPPLGRVVAHRPGHTATHRIVPEAIARGLLSRR